MIHLKSNQKRRGVSFALVMVSLVMMMGMASMTVDIGMMYRARNEAQGSADAAAMAAAWRLMDQNRLRGSSYVASVTAAARQAAVEYAAHNPIINDPPSLDSNDGNSTTGDVVVGRLDNPNDANEAMDFTDSSRFNAVHVFLHRDEVRNGPIDLFFASAFGHETADVSASATAAFFDGVIGWNVNSTTGNAGLLPIALHRDAWNALLAGTLTSGDHYSYNPSNGAVTTGGSDGILELNLYPGGGLGQLPPGNFGTVDIGSPANSTSVISNQILYGLTESDLAYHGGSLELGDDGIIMLNGDTGLSAELKDPLTSIIGKPRAIPIFSSVAGNGENAMFTVVGFVGIRIMAVKLTGSMASKKVIIQPAYVLDDSVIVGENTGQSSFVFKPVQLVR
jgi:Flp pilus assembly protein TadG